MHHVGTLAQTAASPGTYDARSEGYSRHILFGPEQGSVHQCVAVCELAPGGRVDRHFHVFEEGLYVLAGLLTAFDERLAADDFLFVEAGAAHALGNDGSDVVRWLEVAAPLAGAREEAVFDGPGAELDTPYRRGRFELASLPDPAGGIGLAGFDAANVAGGAANVVIGPDFGASQFNLMVIRYQPGAFIKPHDHAFEEGFFFLEGEIEVVLDGATHTLGAGDYFWSGVESAHALANRSSAPVRWLETQAPQPPSRHQFRYRVDWEALVSA